MAWCSREGANEGDADAQATQISMLGEPTKKDFIAMAGIFCRHGASADLVGAVADHFARENSRFDRTRFVAATRKC